MGMVAERWEEYEEGDEKQGDRGTTTMGTMTESRNESTTCMSQSRDGRVRKAEMGSIAQGGRGSRRGAGKPGRSGGG